ncbi:MAG: KEOPS complex kinase/ATPase Bud32 [Candidatus Micrarchaeaceae archaeon]|jgi:Kae1-associated kinase Bud32|nr:Kae1-associated serine/threonine protein kinase [Candidatus Micrarchaeota archaeon]HII10325.1 Kae1-associated serine/threonine protein kinase [Candidatus Micrarchaeota archaeon]
MKMISEGAEAQIHSVRCMGIESVLKRRIRKNYRIEEMDRELRARRTKNEARIIGLASTLQINAPALLLVDQYDIVMSRIAGEQLSSILNRKGRNMEKTFSTLGEYAAILHNNNIAHGDYTPANVIVGRNADVHIIDFGLSEITTSVEEKALDLLLMKRSVNSFCFSKFAESYKRHCKDCRAILKRLEQIERRGRYNTRTLITG